MNRCSSGSGSDKFHRPEDGNLFRQQWLTEGSGWPAKRADGVGAPSAAMTSRSLEEQIAIRQGEASETNRRTRRRLSAAGIDVRHCWMERWRIAPDVLPQH